MRYVSLRKTTVAEKIEELIRQTPPLEGRNSRLGHISKEDFAVVLGVSKSALFNWLDGAEPDPSNRERLAAASGGRYSPEDFATGPDERPVKNRDLRDRLRLLEDAHVRLRDEFDAAVRAMAQRLDDLEDDGREKRERQ